MFDISAIRSDAILFKDMKIGQKFYEPDYNDPLVYVLLDLIIDDNNPDDIEYVIRVYKTDIIERKKIHGLGIRDRHYGFKFVRRDRTSFIAGFQTCMRLYHKHMQIFDQQNAGLNDMLNTYLTMNQEYNKWVKNR